MENNSVVLKKPWCGWTQVVFPGADPIDASYLTLVHIDLMGFIDDYFTNGIAELFIDSEGYDWNIDTANGQMNIYRNDILSCSIDVDDEYMHTLAQQVYDDIMSSLYGWITWVDDLPEVEGEDLEFLSNYLEKTYRHGYPDSNHLPDIQRAIREAIEQYS